MNKNYMNVNKKTIWKAVASFLALWAIFLVVFLAGNHIVKRSTADDEETDAHSLYLEVIGEHRPSEAFLTPDFSSGVSDIRVTVRKRDVNFERLGTDSGYENVEVLQIYYGFLSDGKWVDIPAENYDIHSFDPKRGSSIEAMQDAHVVQMGDYILFAFLSNTLYNHKPPFVTLEDTLGTKTITVNPYAQEKSGDDFEHYGWLLENISDYGTNKFFPMVNIGFAEWTYLVFDSKKLTEDYSITIRLHSDADSEAFATATVTYQDILEALEHN